MQMLEMIKCVKKITEYSQLELEDIEFILLQKLCVL